jgi:hypothetical protein
MENIIGNTPKYPQHFMACHHWEESIDLTGKAKRWMVQRLNKRKIEPKKKVASFLPPIFGGRCNNLFLKPGLSSTSAPAFSVSTPVPVEPVAEIEILSVELDSWVEICGIRKISNIYEYMYIHIYIHTVFIML